MEGRQSASFLSHPQKISTCAFVPARRGGAGAGQTISRLQSSLLWCLALPACLFPTPFCQMLRTKLLAIESLHSSLQGQISHAYVRATTPRPDGRSHFRLRESVNSEALSLILSL
ncbi:hypothetical protein TSMEX_004267 [Taenia solium]|eukprot:TsM_001031600 transcript=TsM_001031600 gene=TsM_001031600